MKSARISQQWPKRGKSSEKSLKSRSLNTSDGWLQSNGTLLQTKHAAPYDREALTSSLPSIRTEWVRKIASPSGLIQTDEPAMYRKEDIVPEVAHSKLVNVADRYSKTFPYSLEEQKFVKFPRLSQKTGKYIDSDGEPDLSLKNINERRAADRTVLPYNFSEQSRSLSRIPGLELNIVTDDLSFKRGQDYQQMNASTLGAATSFPHDPFLRTGKAEPYARTRHGREARATLPLEQGGMFLIELDRATMDGSLQQCATGETYTFGVSLRYGYQSARVCTDLDRHMLETWLQRQGGLTAYLTGPVQVACNCTHVSEGSYAFAFNANLVGSYQLWVFVGKDHVPGCPLPVRFHAGPPSPGNCFINGLGLWSAQAGEEASFEWTAKDRFGNVVDYGGHPFVLTMYGPEEVVVRITDQMDGRYRAAYVPTVAGQYRLSVTLHSEHFPGSPFLVTVKEGPADAGMCTVSGEGVEECQVGSDRHFLVEAVDRFGNRVLHGGEGFAADLQGPTPERVHLIDMDDGTYAGTFTCRWSGRFSLTVTLDGVPVRGSPFVFRVRPGSTLAQNSECTLVKMPMSRLVCVAGVPCSFTIFAKDRYGNQRDEGGDEFVVKLRGSGESTAALLTDNRDGTYLAEFTCLRHGDCFLDIRLDGADINQSPFLLTVDAAKTYAPECVAIGVDSEYGNGLKCAESGRPVQFRIEARDQYGNRVTLPGDDFQVKIVEAVEGIRVRARVVDNGDGTYDVTWTGTVRGEYTLHVSLKEEPIHDSPWRVVVSTGNPLAARCTMSGTGLGGSPAGSVASLLIESNDYYGNVVTQGGAPFEGSLISVDGRHVGACALTDHQDGTYTLAYEAQIMGEYFLAVRLHGEHIHESPFVVFVDHGDTDPARCKLDGRHAAGNSLVACTCGHPAGFKLVAYDRFGNRCSVGGDDFSGVLKGHVEVPVDFVDHSDGSYTCEYTALWAGAYSLHVYLGREEVRGSPYAITAHVDAIHPPSCSVSGGGVYAALAGVQAEFRVQAKDRYENVRGDEDAIEVKIEGPEEVAISRRYLGDGNYDFAWSASAAGNYLVSITCGGEDLATSPYTVSVGPGIVSPINCFAHGDGVSRGVAGVENTFRIQSRDKFGNNRTLGGDKYHVSITGPSASETRVRDREDGAYSVHWTALTKGPYWISVILLGEEISGSPFLAEISPDVVDVKKSTAEGMGLLAVAMFRKSTFTIYSRDRYGNRLDKGGDPWEVSILGSEVPISQVTDNNDGSYTVSYQTTVRGRLQVYISLQGRDMPDSPFEVVSDTKVRRGLAQKMLADRRLAREKRNVSTVNEDEGAAAAFDESEEEEGAGGVAGNDESAASEEVQEDTALDKSKASVGRASSAAGEVEEDTEEAEADSAGAKSQNAVPQAKAGSLLDRISRILCCRGTDAATPRAEEVTIESSSGLPKRGEKLF